jgi:RNA polymerase sigma-70 factor (ECF subfamily)
MEDVSLEIAWSAHRRRLLDIAYRMLGSLSDAEDVVQEAFARLARADRGAIDDLRGWLITVTGRLCLDHLRSAEVKRRAYMGPWLPEPLVDFPGADADPADRVTLDDSLRMALLVLLEQLSPAERTAFVLHDIFQVPFDEVGAIVGRSPAACRQLAARARQRVQSETRTARFHIDATAQQRVAERFAAACNEGDLEALLKVLDPDVVGEFDSGGVLPGAEPILTGSAAVVTRIEWLSARRATFTAARVNGEPGIVITADGQLLSVAALHVRGGRIIDHIHAIGNPAKLSHVILPGPSDVYWR